ncbi:WD40-repeat-containing domain protein, partial [Baffinella frigidus]
EVFCVRYSPDGQFIAASRGDGNIDVYSTGTVYHMAHLGDGSPTCSIRFRPNNQSSKTRNVLTSASANGEVKHWHMTSMKCLHTIVEKDNQVFALDYRFDGLKFATAGSDYKLRIYDESTKSLQATLTGGYGRTKSGHSNRVFSVKFSPDDDNVVLSAGWDNTVQIWDIRMDSPVRSCFGCHVTGDALDLYGTSPLPLLLLLLLLYYPPPSRLLHYYSQT